MINSSLCPCKSMNSYETCCLPFHKGSSPENALQLMRSRYAAYALNIPEYIIETTHPASPNYLENLFSWKRSIAQFSKSSRFNDLKILDFKEQDALATVTFTASITQGEEDVTFTEKSYFEKLKGTWLYHHGLHGNAEDLVKDEELKILPLAFYGNPVLRRKADPVSEITEEIKEFIQKMVQTMDAHDGIGLAAPQVHRSIRLFMIRTPVEITDGQWDFKDVKVFINPKIISVGTDTSIMQEGCLSIPQIRPEVERPEKITIEYTDPEGNLVSAQFEGLEARMVQHENDHIDGVLFIDHLNKKERAKIENSLQNLKKRLREFY